ncbi:hypothetical protein DPMN_115929 [Dreissena polymorpha]|uniref:Uncharacterized protein n=1 Tax=Dreissena polymorpha TaxID=45954 RepID=A0A9D4QU40_DREPO|nr:hypothetical protein DPMN_115807 [Dreissena polymorpha]KAH3842433.1 hypothetical protein DPMN_115929 [Dreissena polymorpha]
MKRSPRYDISNLNTEETRRSFMPTLRKFAEEARQSAQGNDMRTLYNSTKQQTGRK